MCLPFCHKWEIIYRMNFTHNKPVFMYTLQCKKCGELKKKIYEV